MGIVDRPDRPALPTTAAGDTKFTRLRTGKALTTLPPEQHERTINQTDKPDLSREYSLVVAHAHAHGHTHQEPSRTSIRSSLDSNSLTNTPLGLGKS